MVKMPNCMLGALCTVKRFKGQKSQWFPPTPPAKKPNKEQCWCPGWQTLKFFRPSEASQILGWPVCSLLLNLPGLSSCRIPYQESPSGEQTCTPTPAEGSHGSSCLTIPATRGLEGWGPLMQRARWTNKSWPLRTKADSWGALKNSKFTAHKCCMKNKNYSRSYFRKTKMEWI